MNKPYAKIVLMAKNKRREKENSEDEPIVSAPGTELFADLSKDEITQHASVITIDDERVLTPDFRLILKSFFAYSILALILTSATIWMVDYRKDSAFSTLKGEVVKTEAPAETTEPTSK